MGEVLPTTKREAQEQILLFCFGDEMSAVTSWKFFAHLLTTGTDITDMLRKDWKKDRKHLDPAELPEILN